MMIQRLAGWLTRRRTVALFALLALSVTLAFPRLTADDDAEGSVQRDREYYQGLFNHAINYVRDVYVDRDRTDYRELYFGAIRGMLESLGDPHSAFLDPEQLQALEENLDHRLSGGLGIHISIEGDYPVIVAPIEGTPAFRAGLQSQDLILEIDGESTEGMPIDEAIRRLKGMAGDPVTIVIRRQGLPEPLEVTLVREQISIPSVRRAMIDDSIGYIRLVTFSSEADRELVSAVEELREQGMERLILDLRNNSGGLLNAAKLVTNRFIPSGLMVSTQGRYAFDHQRDYADPSKCILPRMPMVALINRGSASASEILAGALQDTNRAPIVGMPSYGKGSVQDVHRFRMATREPLAMRVTVQLYYTPSGKSIHGEGVTPDIQAEFPRPTIDDQYMYIKALDGGYVDDFIENHGTDYGSEDIDGLVTQLEDDCIPINRALLEREIRDRLNRFNVNRLFDRDYDVQLKAAIDEVKQLPAATTIAFE